MLSRKFAVAQKEHREAIAKAISANAEYGDNGDDTMEDYSPALSRMLKSYNSGDVDVGQQIAEFMQSGLAACLVCIEDIKKTEAIWNCSNCYGIFHLVCIQRWIRQCVYQHASASFEDASAPRPETLPWNCPKCRHEYLANEAPTRYCCYCGKTEDPDDDSWLLPHSCGQVCGKALKPKCAHPCLVLCHPGPCPPCPAFVTTSCFCGKSNAVPKRCVDRLWSCLRKCEKPLRCGRHKCDLKCHSGECKSCSELVVKSCRCGKHSERRPCLEESWVCHDKCGKQLECGRHQCQVVCQVKGSVCPPCPLTQPRKCPCGKTSISGLSCDVDTMPSCFETCDKLLDCGIHKCIQGCHVGPCGDCKEIVKAKCRCGARVRQMTCHASLSNEVTCDVKCSKFRQCLRHQCKKKCCISCPPCDLPCQRPLQCGRHKCASRCHQGACYPCSEIIEISCACGSSVIRVPCGRQNRVKQPKCSKFCGKLSNCRHEVVPHRCHFGDCPPCSKKCDGVLKACGHHCQAECHDFVWVEERDREMEAKLRAEPQGPWMLAKVEVKRTRKAIPCPPCRQPVEVTCLGGHETLEVQCALAKVESCHRPCGRTLKCSHHKCQRECHDPKKECDECYKACEQSRPQGCHHDCSRGQCHPGKCPSCRRILSKRCYCDQMALAIECGKFTSAQQDDLAKLLSCGNRCTRNMPCGHRCFSKCHDGKCEQAMDCAELLKRRCACRRIRIEEKCLGRFLGEAAAKLPALPCDEECKRKAERAAAAKQAAKLELEQQKSEDNDELNENENQAEFQVRQRRRRNRRRRDEEDEDDESWLKTVQSLVTLKRVVVFSAFFAVFGTMAFILVNY